MSVLERLARRAAGGDLLAARQLVASLEARKNHPTLEVERIVVDANGKTWGYAGQMRGGHKLFVEPETGRIALGDDSGDTPLDAMEMNGFLQWVDASRPVLLFTRDGPSDESWNASIPVIREFEGSFLAERGVVPRSPRSPRHMMTTGTPLDGVLWLAEKLGMDVATGRLPHGGGVAEPDRTFRIFLKDEG